MTLIDFFPDDFLIIVDESHITIPQIGGMYAGDRSRKTTLVDYGFRLPSALVNRPLNFEEFEGKIDQMLFVSATPNKYENEHELLRAEQIIRPTGLLDPAKLHSGMQGKSSYAQASTLPRRSAHQPPLSDLSHHRKTQP